MFEGCGLYKPESVADKDRKEARHGVVIAVGANLQGLFQEGDNIIFSKYGATEFEYKGSQVYFVDTLDILGVISEH